MHEPSDGVSVKKLPSHKELVDRFEYQPDTGRLIYKPLGKEYFTTTSSWRRFNTFYSGKIAGYVTHCGRHKRITIKESNYMVHRVIWKLKEGKEPPEVVYHKDGNGLNNKWNNLAGAQHSDLGGRTGGVNKELQHA